MLRLLLTAGAVGRMPALLRRGLRDAAHASPLVVQQDGGGGLEELGRDAAANCDGRDNAADDTDTGSRGSPADWRGDREGRGSDGLRLWPRTCPCPVYTTKDNNS